MVWSFCERSFLRTSAIFMWRLCLNIRDVINTCDDTIYNLSAYVCDWSLSAHKILHPILSLKSGVTYSSFLGSWSSSSPLPSAIFLLTIHGLLSFLDFSRQWFCDRRVISLFHWSSLLFLLITYLCLYMLCNAPLKLPERFCFLFSVYQTYHVKYLGPVCFESS